MNDNIFGNKREVSLPLRLKILFGDAITQVLYGIFVFLMIFVINFVTEADFSNFTLIGSQNTKGNITNATETNFMIGNNYVLAFDYTFLVDDKIYNGVSFSTDEPNTDEVIIEYSAKNPRNSRIMDMRQRIFPFSIAFIAIFPLIISFILFRGFKRDLKAISLMKNSGIGYEKVLRTKMILIENNEFKSPRFTQVLSLLILPFVSIYMILRTIFS